MWRSKQFIVIALLTVVMLLGSVAGASCGSSEDTEVAPSGGGPGGAMSPGMGLSDDMLARVAEILGIDQEEVADAFEQAQSEMMEDMPEGGQLPEDMPSGGTPPEGMSPGDMPAEGTAPEGMSPGMGFSDDLLARVAEILGIDQEEVANAFEQAQSEMAEETAPSSSSQE